MTKKKSKRHASLLLCLLLITAMAFMTAGCGKKNNEETKQNQPTATVAPTDSEKEPVPTTEVQEKENTPEVKGEGQTVFNFQVVDGDGNEKVFEIHTDKTSVGEALLEVGLIAGETSEYGLYVKTVNGITADYDVDQSYWAFYIDGEYAMTGVDSTPAEAGKTYLFKVEK